MNEAQTNATSASSLSQAGEEQLRTVEVDAAGNYLLICTVEVDAHC
jgi:hypothetical protein